MSTNNSWESEALKGNIKKQWYEFLEIEVNANNYPTTKDADEQAASTRSAKRSVLKVMGNITKGKTTVDAAIETSLETACEELVDKLDARIAKCGVLSATIGTKGPAKVTADKSPTSKHPTSVNDSSDEDKASPHAGLAGSAPKYR